MPAVIFDIDGVLVDSYDAHLRSWQAVAGRHGHEMTETQFAATFGQTSRDIIRQLWSSESLTEQQVSAIDEQKEAAYRDIVAADFPAMPGAIALIDALHAAGFALAMGSSGPPENVQLAIEQLGRRALFGAAVSGADVTHGKPDPQVFQLAAERLGIPPKECLVIEDAAVGIAAANAAGMVSVALVSTGHTRDEYREADHVINELSELSPARLREWL